MARMTGGFQTVEPSLVGWLALLAPGALVGAGIAWVAGVFWWFGALVGAVMIWRFALYLDFRRQQDMEVSYQFDAANLAELDQMTAHLRSLGIVADGAEVEGPDGPEFHLTVRYKDRAAVEAEIGWARDG